MEGGIYGRREGKMDKWKEGGTGDGWMEGGGEAVKQWA